MCCWPNYRIWPNTSRKARESHLFFTSARKPAPMPFTTPAFERSSADTAIISSQRRNGGKNGTVLQIKSRQLNNFQFSTDIKSLISGVVGLCHVFNISYWLEIWLLEENKSTTSGDNIRRLFQNKSCKPISLLFSFWGLWFESVLPALPFLTCDFRMIFNN